MDKQLKIGFFGFGVVGQGLYDIIEKTNFEAEILKICVKDKTKRRPIPAHYFTFDKKDILENDEINLVVELIDDAEAAFEIVKEALQKGKNVVTANKKMLAEHLEELVKIEKENEGTLLYEAAVCGSIPIIRTLAEYYDNELLYSVAGIFNGSSNYILTKVIQENMSYEEALKQAQDLGFAETDPTLDVAGFDALYKLCLVTAQAYGLFIEPNAIFRYGIQSLSKHDIQFANEKGYKIKLLASGQKINEESIALSVMPNFIDKNHYLYNIENEYNGVIVEAAFSDKQAFVGKGAGGHPTGSAVLSDISANRYSYQYEYRKVEKNKHLQYSLDKELKIYLRYAEEQELEQINFLEIIEKYVSKHYRYIVANISLSELYAKKQILEQKNFFVAVLP